MPTTRDTSLESPMNMVCSPKRWRVRTSQRTPTMIAVQSPWIDNSCSQGVEAEANGRPTIHCHTELSSAPRKA